jgi:hypothetical protein
VAQTESPQWEFLTKHAQVLVCVAGDPGIRLRDIGDRLGITERAAHRIVAQLRAAGYLTRQREGRRNHYTIAVNLPVPDGVAQERSIGDLLTILTDTPRSRRRRGVAAAAPMN